MINDFTDNINLDEFTSSKHLFSSFNRYDEDDYGIGLQHSRYYSVHNCIQILLRYRNKFSMIRPKAYLINLINCICIN